MLASFVSALGCSASGDDASSDSAEGELVLYGDAIQVGEQKSFYVVPRADHHVRFRLPETANLLISIEGGAPGDVRLRTDRGPVRVTQQPAKDQTRFARAASVVPGEYFVVLTHTGLSNFTEKVTLSVSIDKSPEESKESR